MALFSAAIRRDSFLIIIIISSSISICIIIWFSSIPKVSYNPSPNFYPKPTVGKVVIIEILFFLSYLGVSFSFTLIVLSKKDKHSQKVHFFVFHNGSDSQISLLICLSVISLTLLSFHLFHRILWLICYHLLALTYKWKGKLFFYNS